MQRDDARRDGVGVDILGVATIERTEYGGRASRTEIDEDEAGSEVDDGRTDRVEGDDDDVDKVDLNEQRRQRTYDHLRGDGVRGIHDVEIDVLQREVERGHEVGVEVREQRSPSAISCARTWETSLR